MYKIQEKLDEIIKNQEILNKIQVAIYDLFLRIESKMPSGDKIRESSKEFYAIHHRGIIGMINEWRAHNLLYNLHIKRDRTGTVDLNKDQSIWAKIAYAILSFLYF